jgi:hypothetical protein
MIIVDITGSKKQIAAPKIANALENMSITDLTDQSSLICK